MRLCVLALDYDGTVAVNDSRWLRDVFGDYPLALGVQALEERCRNERDSAAVAASASAIRGRYDLASNADMLPGAVAE